jgi:hypothetical protein
MRRALLLLLLAAMPALAESIVYEECTSEPPESAYEPPLCADYELNTVLLDAAKAGDASAVALLEKRYPLTDTYREKHRLAAVLLRRASNDTTIWNEIFADAQLAVRFAYVNGERPPEFEAWCEEHDFYSVRHDYVLDDAFNVAAADPRSHALLVKALASEERNLVLMAVVGLIDQHDLDSLPAIDKALEQFPEEASYLADSIAEMGSERAQAIAAKYRAPEEQPAAEDEEDQEP